MPRNIQSYKLWIKKWVPGGNQAHTFGLAAVCWSIWKGNAEIEFVLTKNPLAVIMRTCSFLSYWSGLYGSEIQGKLLDGIKVMMSVACRLMTQDSAPRRLPLPAPEEDRSDSES